MQTLVGQCIEHPNTPVHGYCYVRKGGQRYLAHRLAWMDAFGPIPDGLCVCHRCDNRRCINVDHLFLGTHQENMIDMMTKGRHVAVRGSKQGLSKLKESDVLEIRVALEKGELQRVIAARYGVNQTIVSDIKLRKTWRHI